MPINTGGTASSGKKNYGSPQTGAGGTVSGGSVRSVAGGGGYGGYGGAKSTGRPGGGYSGSAARSSPEGGGGRGSPAGASRGSPGGNQGGQRSGAGGGGGVRNVSGLGGYGATRESLGSMRSSALAGAPRMATSLPGSYAGPKGLVGKNFALSNQALAAPFGPYGNFDATPQQHLMQRGMARGWTPNATRGMLGNFAIESGFNPLAAGDLQNKAGLAAGLGQHRLERLAALEAETQPFGGLQRNPKNKHTGVFTTGPTLDQQFDFVDRQLSGLSTKGFSPDRKAVRAGWALANPDISVADATGAFAKDYERPSKSAFRTSMPQRLAGARFGMPDQTQIAAARPSQSFNVTPASYTTTPRAKPLGILSSVGKRSILSARPQPILGLGMPRAKPLTPGVIGKSLLGVNRGAYYGY